jgi:NAD-dependent SIR2 family protein deacetylase
VPSPPYQVIRDLIAQGSVVFFLGAGASASVRPAKAQWVPGTIDYPPSGSELSRHLADTIGFASADEHDRTDLPRVASYFEYVQADRELLRSELRRIFKPQFKPGKIHEYLAKIQAPALIVTTNYDDLIEQAFEAIGRSYHLVVHPADRLDLYGGVLWRRAGQKNFEEAEPNTLSISLENDPIVYKMHGSIDPTRQDSDNFVITEEDYVDFLARMTGRVAIPAAFELIFRRSRFLFLGYSLRDWNFRVMLRALRVHGGKRSSNPDPTLRSWAIQLHPSDIESDLWSNQKVLIYDLDINTFADQLKALK